MAKPMVKTPGPIDTDAIAWAVRETLLGQMTQEAPQPATAGTWRTMVKLAAMVTMLAGLAAFGRAMGWNA